MKVTMATQFLTLTLLLLGSVRTHCASKPHHPPYVPPHRWCTRSGETLKTALERWAHRAGWSVQWQLSYDYPIAVSTCLTGSFVSVLNTVSQAYQNAETPLYFNLYPQQRLLVVTQ